MKVIEIRTGTHEERLNSLHFIAKRAAHCDQCVGLAAVLMAGFSAAIEARGVSDEDFRVLVDEFRKTSTAPTDVDLANAFVRSMGKEGLWA